MPLDAGMGVTPPAIASSVKQWNGAAWTTKPFWIRVPGAWFGTTWVERLRTSSSELTYEGAEGAATWVAGDSFASDAPLIVSGGAVYQDSQGWLGDPVLGVKYLSADRRQTTLAPGTYRQRARVSVEKRTAGPNNATLVWSAYGGGPEWSTGNWSSDQGWDIYLSPSFTITPDMYESWRPNFRLDQGELGDNAVWRLGVDYVELLNGSSQPIVVWSESNFLVRTASGWLRA